MCVGFTIPREAVAEELVPPSEQETSSSSAAWSPWSLKSLTACHQDDQVKVRSLQSSDFAIDLATSISVAAGLATQSGIWRARTEKP